MQISDMEAQRKEMETKQEQLIFVANRLRREKMFPIENARVICPRCGRDITARFNQADVTAMHMRDCEGRKFPLTTSEPTRKTEMTTDKKLDRIIALLEQILKSQAEMSVPRNCPVCGRPIQGMHLCSGRAPDYSGSVR